MEDDQRWIERLTGGTVTRFERTPGGASRGTWLVDVTHADGRVEELVVRRDLGDGPLSKTDISLAREATLYRALNGTDVALPGLLAIAPDGQALLMRRVAGSPDLATCPPEVVPEVANSFVEELARLHRVDPASLDLPGFGVPASTADHALVDLDLWEGIFRGRVRRPAPLIRYAFRWLRAHPPAEVARTVVCHGDVGPGNFLFQQGRVTALLDWEFAHLGDAMDDIAWLTIRGQGFGDSPAVLRHYSAASGIAVNPSSVRYYQVLVLVRMAVACMAALDGRQGNMNSAVYFNLLPSLEVRIPPLIAELLGADLESAVPAADVPATELEVLDAIESDISTAIGVLASEPALAVRLQGSLSLLGHVRAERLLGDAVERESLDDAATILGSRPGSWSAASRALDQFVEESGGDELALLRFFARQTRRQLRLWPAALARSAPLPPVVV